MASKLESAPSSRRELGRIGFPSLIHAALEYRNASPILWMTGLDMSSMWPISATCAEHVKFSAESYNKDSNEYLSSLCIHYIFLGT